MEKVAMHPAQLELLQHWFQHELPIIEEANEMMIDLLNELADRSNWDTNKAEECLDAIETIGRLITTKLSQVIIPF